MVRFLLDASLHHPSWLAACGASPLSISSRLMRPIWEGVSDAEVLALAARQARILVTHDFQTMPKHGEPRA